MSPDEEIEQFKARYSPSGMNAAEELLYEAWCVIANVSEGRWDEQSEEWRAAAIRWRDRWHSRCPGCAALPDDGLCGEPIGILGGLVQPCIKPAGHRSGTHEAANGWSALSRPSTDTKEEPPCTSQ